MTADVLSMYKQEVDSESTLHEEESNRPSFHRRIWQESTTLDERSFDWQGASKPYAKRFISTEALYSFAEDFPETAMNNALINLKKAHALIVSAIEAETRGDAIAADCAIQQFEATLPILFRSRSLADGYGMVINAIIIALRNKAGMPLERDHIEALRQCIGQLILRPRMSDMDAVSYIRDMKNVGLDPNRHELDYVADIPE